MNINNWNVGIVYSNCKNYLKISFSSTSANAMYGVFDPTPAQGNMADLIILLNFMDPLVTVTLYLILHANVNGTWQNNKTGFCTFFWRVSTSGNWTGSYTHYYYWGCLYQVQGEGVAINPYTESAGIHVINNSQLWANYTNISCMYILLASCSVDRQP